jgi:hypothetical protein
MEEKKADYFDDVSRLELGLASGGPSDGASEIEPIPGTDPLSKPLANEWTQPNWDLAEGDNCAARFFSQWSALLGFLLLGVQITQAVFYVKNADALAAVVEGSEPECIRTVIFSLGNLILHAMTIGYLFVVAVPAMLWCQRLAFDNVIFIWGLEILFIVFWNFAGLFYVFTDKSLPCSTTRPAFFQTAMASILLYSVWLLGVGAPFVYEQVRWIWQSKEKTVALQHRKYSKYLSRLIARASPFLERRMLILYPSGTKQVDIIHSIIVGAVTATQEHKQEEAEQEGKKLRLPADLVSFEQLPKMNTAALERFWQTQSGRTNDLACTPCCGLLPPLPLIPRALANAAQAQRSRRESKRRSSIRPRPKEAGFQPLNQVLVQPMSPSLSLSGSKLDLLQCKASAGPGIGWKLPRNATGHVFLILGPAEIHSVARVCKRWHDYMREDTLWVQWWHTFTGMPVPEQSRESLARMLTLLQQTRPDQSTGVQQLRLRLATPNMLHTYRLTSFEVNCLQPREMARRVGTFSPPLVESGLVVLGSLYTHPESLPANYHNLEQAESQLFYKRRATKDMWWQRQPQLTGLADVHRLLSLAHLTRTTDTLLVLLTNRQLFEENVSKGLVDLNAFLNIVENKENKGENKYEQEQKATTKAYEPDSKRRVWRLTPETARLALPFPAPNPARVSLDSIPLCDSGAILKVRDAIARMCPENKGLMMYVCDDETFDADTLAAITVGFLERATFMERGPL